MKYLFNLLFLMSFSLGVISFALGQEEMPVSWTFSIEEIGENNYNLIFKADIEDTWTVYSQFIEEGGPVPTTIWYENEDVIERIGTAAESGHLKKGMDPVFEMEVTKFLDDEPYIITQQVKVKDPSEKLKGYLTFMTCDDERCLPPTDIEFTFDFASGKAGIDNGLEAADLASIDGNVLDQIRPQITESYETPLTDCGDTGEKKSSLPWMFFFGFVGGLFALLTPCVFPMIPLTVSFFTKDTKRKGWVNGLIYGLSIVVIYVSLGLLLTAFFGEEALNRLSTNWIANTLFFLIFIGFAFSFFGYYEITLPSSWSTKSDQMADKGGFLGIFFMAFTLALVSFSCTGPIIGTAIVQAATSAIGPAVVMLGFSLALALPFGLFAAFPAWLNTLPQSGGWMNSVKVFLGFIEVALAFKFLSVADMTNHWGFLKYEPFMAIWVVVSTGMALYSFKIIKFPHDSPGKKLTSSSWVLGLGSLALAAYLGSGFLYNDDVKSYNSLKLMSGIAPPSNYNFLLPKPELDPLIKQDYPSYHKCANNIDCFKDYYEGLAFAKKEQRPVLLDFTGFGCVNCRKVEEHIWVDNNVRSKLNNDFVLVSLYVDDDKKLEDIYISKTRKKKLRNVGNKWADFQIVNFKQNSQPLYVMMTPEENVIAPPRGYKEGINEYLEYLDCGLSTFKAQSSL
ncbi:MAG: cytochrome c biogenesis protein CcdA [Saprospiraceae bacterium]|nr:cytochrome c biogenesis protein CcdA [Saprospiraceae bacterium]